MPNPASSTERRAGDRRQGDRRRTDRRHSAAGPETQAADSQFVPRDEAGYAAGDGALVRVARVYAAARAVLGVALVLAQVAAGLAGTRSPTLVTTLCVAYAALALAVWLLPRLRASTERLAHSAAPPDQRRWQWLATIGVDLGFFIALHLLDRSTSFNFAALLVLPVLMTGVLMPRIAALGTAAAVALVLLAAALQTGVRAGDPTLAFTGTGFAGIGFFVIALLAGELAARLTREETAARESLELARRQAQLNRLVIQEMADGVLVIDRGLRVRVADPAARALLVSQGAGPVAPFSLQGGRAWGALAQAAGEAMAQGDWPAGGREVALVFEDGWERRLRLRVRFTAVPAGETGGPEPYSVLLLEDLRTAQARLRQEKLAAMGRVSAGIAHEIRNPLAAISQANALLLEDELHPDQQRLARMVADNVRRLQRIVDDVMELSHGSAAVGAVAAPIDARAVVAATAVDWARTNGLELGAQSRLRTEIPDAPLGAVFDADHLRRVLVNLLDNALRHAGDAPGAVVLRLSARDDSQARLQVLSDGAAIPPEVERHLFEPFFSTRSRGSGLGLYICRELCERYGASIEYRPRPGAERWRNEFAVTMRRATPAPPEAVLPLHG
jgi:two-component system, NtrC family, sensor histidine kinase PilS